MVRILVIFIGFICCLPALGKEIRFEHYNDELGLSHNSVRHIVQDDFGFLWLGTFGGLNRFDGYEFKPYLSSDRTRRTVYNDDITALAIDEENKLMWIGTRNGLTVQNLVTHQFKTFFPNEKNEASIAEHEIRSLLIDSHQQIWIGTKTKGLCIYDQKSKRFSKVDFDGLRYVKDIFQDRNGIIWVSDYLKGALIKVELTEEGKIASYERIPLLNSKKERVKPFIDFIYQDHKGDIFTGTRDGLFKLNTEKKQLQEIEIEDSERRELLGPYFICIAKAPDGKYWVGTLGGIIVCDELEDISKGKYEWHYSKLYDESCLVDNQVTSLYFDRSGVLWIGTENGLDKYDPYRNQFIIQKDIAGLIGNKIPRISGFAKTGKNELLVSTHDNGLFLLHDEKFRKTKVKEKEIASVYCFDGKTAYCGLWNGGLLEYNCSTNNYQLITTGLEGVPIFAINELSSEDILVGSFGNGAIIYNPKSKSISKLDLELTDVQINKMTSNRHGIVWLATETGIIKYNLVNGESEFYNASVGEKEGLSNENVKDIFIDVKGKVWAATRNGLNYYDPMIDNFLPMLTPAFLHENWVTDVSSNSAGDLWLNFNNNRVGCYKTASKTLETYYVESGNRIDNFSHQGFMVFNDSLIYLSGKGGVIHFSASKIVNDTISLPPFVSNLKVQNKEVLVGQEFNGQLVLNEDVNYSRQIKLNYENRNFSVTFSAPSWVNERYNRFMYKLEGFDENWNEVRSNSRNIQYTNLFYGDYKLHIKSANSFGVWSDVSTYNIEIEPPIWLSYQAILLYVLLLSLSTYVYLKIRRRQLELKNQLMVEKLERENDEKLANEKFRFFTNISHELRTPLSLIVGPLKQLRDISDNSDFQQNRLELMQKNTNRLMHLANQILEFRKAEAGELKLKVSQVDIREITTQIYESFKSVALEKEINFKLNISDGNYSGWLDVDKYDKVMFNLLSNAFKFTSEKGNVELKMELRDEKYLYVQVIDDGIGIPYESQKNIFSRFYQAENSLTNTTGSGIGLSLVKALVEVNKGELRVVSQPEKGSTFKVKIPIDVASFNEKERVQLDVGLNSVLDNSPTDSKHRVSNTEIKEKILLVEDNHDLREFIADYLSDYFKVYQAENGKQALELCREKKPIICVSDVMMPEMDGFEFCKTLKLDEQISHIPVVLLTALTDKENKKKGYKLGADGYLEKPFEVDVLLSRIEGIIDTRKALKEKFTQSSDVAVSVLTHSPVDEEFMEKVAAIVDENLREESLTVNFLCNKMGVSSSNLYRKIKELTDLSPNEFIRTIRLKKSIELLQSKRFNVSEVATAVGFNDPLYFSRCFKKQFGYPPSKVIKH
ncbi:hybrid sensor histidine kinase/response regulator [Prolixibacteraceae bacterium JC049]|nr:hybrid sensor histidine kinase/response regulator [Prolixibacteraceae bacterium JC049]